MINQDIREFAAEVINAFDKQGFHRTGTDVDWSSAEWLADQVRKSGIEAALEDWRLQRVDVNDAFVEFDGKRIDGIPFFEGASTGPEGVASRLSTGAGDGIVIVETAPGGDAPAFDAARASDATAVVAVTGRDDAVGPRNADDFETPSGPPVLQVAPAALPVLRDAMDAGHAARVVVDFERTPADAYNVVADISGRQPGLKPLVVVTPRSGWWHCAAERGGGLVCWLVALKALADSPPDRAVHFVASSGHELGYIGLEAYIARRLELPAEAHLWVHLGANIGAASPRWLAVRASAPALAEQATVSLKESLLGDVEVHPNPSGPIRGEAATIADHGGRFLSIIGANDHFHLLSDRWPDAVNVDDVAAVAKVVANLVQEHASA